VGLRVNPIFTLHAVDNLALSALSIRLENREPCVCLGGAAGQGWHALELALDAIAAGEVREALIFGGDDIEGEAYGVALVLRASEARAQLVGVQRERASGDALPHTGRGLACWLEALAAAPTGPLRYVVPNKDGDGIDRITVIAEIA
jgi:hypothetical protein